MNAKTYYVVLTWGFDKDINTNKIFTSLNSARKTAARLRHNGRATNVALAGYVSRNEAKSANLSNYIDLGPVLVER